MATVSKAHKKPRGTIVVQVGYADVLSAVEDWQPEELETLIGDLQFMARQRKKYKEAKSDFQYSDSELEALRWQALAEKYELLNWPLPSRKSSLEEMSSILTADVVVPSDEEVDEIIIQARLERTEGRA